MRVSTGVPGFKKLTNGGLIRDRLYILSGPPGSGKTTFCSHFATQGVGVGEKTLFVTLHETQEDLTEDMSNFSFGFNETSESSNFRFLNLHTEVDDHALLEFGRSGGVTERLTSLIESNDVERVVIDSMMLLDYFFSDASEEITGFLTKLKETDTTVLLVSEMTDPSSYSDEHYLSHGVIFLHNFLEGGEMKRGIQVIKMRGTDIDTDIREVSFSKDGLQVHPEQKVEP
jgi:KaiC/GvpD/RAD55 family RecA-like ATPase